MFRSLLVANRGEIACRIFRTARRMGLRCIAVYSEADAHALHVELADEAYPIGPPPAASSYLRIDRILDAARQAGAEAIHPGYGFLAETADFAEACEQAGIVFVGPPAPAIRAMGSKAAAKALMAEAGVPLVPGYHGDAQDDARLSAEAERIGYPVLIKASAGGGGRGMHIVERAADFSDALAAARRVAKAAFGDDRVLLERYLRRPRHIEVQVLGDAHGTILDLSTRDCSVQRRYQKVVEEAPAPDLPDAVRTALAEAAVDAARAVGYRNAGTVEFIAEDDAFYFMEMNTRLQVEHPVTELITGLDLVEWQLRIAAGEALPFREPPPVAGHAVEARLCAEDPTLDWRPAVGRLDRFLLPDDAVGVRIDTGVREGDTITPFYDSMIAKVIAHGEDRAAALRRLGLALAAIRIDGVTTNLDLLRRIVGHPSFRAGDLSTGFIAAHADDLLAAPRPVPDRALIAASAALLLDEQDRAERFARESGDPHSPWNRRDGWRLHGVASAETELIQDGVARRVRAEYGAGAWTLRFATETGEAVALDLRARRGLDHDSLLLDVDGVRTRATVRRYGDDIVVTLSGAEPASATLTVSQRLGTAAAALAASGSVAAPIPGRVVKVMVEAGQEVARGEALVILEAMKTELRIAAPTDGTVVRVCVQAGDLVSEGTELAFVEAEAGR
ncbi:acetyl/propionyl/methylcrotonyl-CoA carboxylase subunit alpha [Elioraea sp.]|uniref:acetyl/propionyl/methylcrotonyl-CoA carboxylase subunit alpha n=1 Tax=Elioraea sp. TaxID=2185103 RepID=UPI003F6EE862